MRVRPGLLRGHQRGIVRKVAEPEQQVAYRFSVVTPTNGQVAGCACGYEIADAYLRSRHLLVDGGVIGK